ncbi:nucleotide disphospho-sugar-binding domain-containing protein [Kutzneria albida]|uniref:Uncharacterized protein n=1 Tax=Kutzneria albida DSM 43870 TaxID=1449976 RepID=W5WKA1_9PSEU|nr:nucleotide disphospho-sugar-binding domain-containing protein [Kutzneria albida]AHI01171.1 hypothetical protein KALB_7813 [Kutzneria albida DSM 43870]
MRVLITSVGGAGHTFPMISLGWALRAAGHEVLYVVGGDLESVKRSGLQHVDAAPGVDMREVLSANPQPGESYRSTLKPGAFEGDLSEHPVARMFARLADLTVDGLVGAALDWRPDLVVHEGMQAIGGVAAARAGVPAVSLGIGIVHEIVRVGDFHRAQLPSFQRHGLDEVPVPAAGIEVGPPSMGAREGGWLMRYVPFNGGGQVPDWLLRDAGRPRIAVTLGTVVPELTGLGPVGNVLAAAPRVDAEFVLAVGRTDLSALGELPSNVRVVDWVPLNALLESSTAVIHHGGAGTAMTALESGIPQLVVPQGADHPMNAAAVVKRGVGLSATDEEVDAELINRVLVEDSLRAAAAEVRAEIRSMPTPAEVVGRLENLVGQNS